MLRDAAPRARIAKRTLASVAQIGMVSAAPPAPDGGWSVQTGGRPWSLRSAAGAGDDARALVGNAPSLPCRRVTSYAGGDAVQFQLRPGDTWRKDADRNHRAERAEVAQQGTGPSRDIWAAFGMTVLPGAPTTGKWVELGQLHNRRDKGELSPSPAVSQGLDRGDVFRIEIRSSAQDPLWQNPKPVRLYTDRAFRRGVPYRFVYHVIYDAGSGGLVDVWINGVRRVHYRGPVGYVDARPPYWKFGIYRQPSDQVLTVRYSGIAVCG